ncbi:MAG: peptidoglycan bridge formation glycyltransferase FemA/FemB family protein [Candidatus Moraniibacteriota bacterium]
MDKQENFLAEHTKDGGFLQSEYWKNFQENFGNEVFLCQEENFHGLFVEYKLPIVGKYWLCPRGPVVSREKKVNAEIRGLIKQAQNRKIGWIRMEPQTLENLERIKKSCNFKLVKSPKNHEPEETLMIDLQSSPDEILSEMKSKTRYNIRLSQKKGAVFQEEDKKKSFESFWKLLQETSQRDRINTHPKEYYKKMLEVIPEDKIKLFMAYVGEKPLGGIIVSFYGGVATYLHGASSSSHRNLMANYGLQWHAIKEAQKVGVKKYDLGGTSVKNKKKTWGGITRFKKGFCPKCEPVEFPGCHDLIIDSQKYFLYRLIQKVKNLIK